MVAVAESQTGLCLVMHRPRWWMVARGWAVSAAMCTPTDGSCGTLKRILPPYRLYDDGRGNHEMTSIFNMRDKMNIKDDNYNNGQTKIIA